MTKLTIYDTGNYFTAAEKEGAFVGTVGGGTGYRYAVLCLPDGSYLARARRKGGEYGDGQCDDECRTDDARVLREWDERLARTCGAR